MWNCPKCAYPVRDETQQCPVCATRRPSPENVAVAAQAREPGLLAITLLASLPSIAWALAQMWALFRERSTRICTPDYRALVAQTPQLRVPTTGSPFFWIPFIFMLLGLLAGVIVFLLVK